MKQTLIFQVLDFQKSRCRLKGREIEDCHQWTKIIWRENLLRFMALQRESIITTFLLRINRIWYMNGIWPWHYSAFLSRICCFEWIVLLTYLYTYLTEVLRCSTNRLSCFLNHDFVLTLVDWLPKFVNGMNIVNLRFIL